MSRSFASVSRALCLALSVWPVAPGLAARADQSGVAPLGRAQPWERVVRGAFENRGQATVARLGDRWVLTVTYRGVHTTYIDATTIDLSRHVGKNVIARYRYVDRVILDPKCFRSPCGPVTERRILLQQLRVAK